MNSIAPAQLLASLNWRYATKVFDPARPLPADVWAALEEALVLTPSSFGLQPYRFLDVRTPAIRAKLREHAWGQAQVTAAAHFVVFASRAEMTAADIDHLVDRIAEVRGQPREASKDYRDMMTGALLAPDRKAHIPAWAAHQAYIALGELLTAAAVLGVDACPMEGFDRAKFDEILGTQKDGYTCLVSAALGYRTAGDKYATLKKVRYPKAELVKVV